MVVDDDKNTRRYFEALLRREGYTVSVAQNGEEALELMEREVIDLAVLDIMMPKMDGYEFTKTLRYANNTLASLYRAPRDQCAPCPLPQVPPRRPWR